jgi:hypothetical protein
MASALFVILAAGSPLSCTTTERKRGYEKETEKSSLQEEKGVSKSVDAILQEYMSKREKRRPTKARMLLVDP